ncbi:DUF4402 domain-containing protein [Novosphingobium sp. FSY-8]|uniref:DUF4402 domain-containing protein n=1 Tax=Novosphingobium ovatum TaxID=1908523 RepID=A0ABW9XEH1_9SPHN|nr:DUF4402 domain-containing protein [Novosphingobium ovatum]NBC36915.1 DUF4402 domain-containing protein [Novosphingobium ovatum]
MKKFLIAAAALAVSAAPAYAASGNTSTAAGTATAEVVAPIVLTHASGAALSFGKFTTGTGGTVVVTAAGVGSVTADVGFVPGSTVSADSYSLTGDANRSFSIATTSGSVSNGSRSMSFTTAPSASGGTLSASGAASFTVGGTLTVAGTEPAGVYTGSYNATVTYN